MTDTAVRADQASASTPRTRSTRPPRRSSWPGREILAAAGLLAEPVRFAYYGLEEPPKDEVLASAGLHGPPAAGVPDRHASPASRATWSCR